MVPAKLFSLAVLLTTFFAFTGQSQPRPKKYTDYDRGYYYYYNEKRDSAFLMFTRYVNNPDDSLKKGKAFNYMGEIQWEMSDLYGAQENFMGAIHTLNPQNQTHREDLGYTYNLLGNVSLDLKQYDEAIQFYNNAMAFFQGSEYLLEIMNGKATALQKKGSYRAAIALYDSILALKPGSQDLMARVIDNRATTKWLEDPAYNALPELQAALQIRAESQNNAGLNASYAHLSDYYAKSNPDSALWYANKMLEQAKENQSPVDILEAMDKLILLNSNGASKEYWYMAFKNLNDSFQLSRDTTRNRFALIRYDVQKSKADNLLLQQHITRQQLWMVGLIGIAGAIFAGLYIWYGKRKRRIQHESENAIRNARLKTSQKVHDVVANGLYGIMNELEHRETIDKEPLMNRIEGLYEKSRNISYEDIPEDNHANYDAQVHELLTAFANEQTKVIVVGNQQKFWSKITSPQKQELHLVLNELLVNMKKHSQARNVSVVFKEENGRGLITYKDDGTGFRDGYEKGNGLKNTVSRINSLNGAINFGNGAKAGVWITISFPLEPSKI